VTRHAARQGSQPAFVLNRLEPKYYERRPRRSRRYYDDEVEEVASESAEFEVIEVADHRQYISQWRNLEDEPVEFGEIPIEDGELLPAGALDDEPPDTQRLTEASGNEGASFERSYHRAVLVLWRRDRYAAVTGSESSRRAVHPRPTGASR
jgi:hypothetical protein